MGRIVVINHVSLDGVMQAPAGAEEDARDGFAYGGWAVPYQDPVMAEVMGKGMTGEGSLLLGRRTYEHFYEVWPKRTDGNPYTELLNRKQKYVASTTLSEPLPWVNSTLLNGDAAAAVTALKREDDGDLGILGSGVLVQSLLAHGLIDEFLLTIHPLVLGSGRRLFSDGGAHAAFELVDVTPTTTGVLITTYRRREA